MSAAGAWHSEVLPHTPHTHAQWDPILDKAVLRRSPDCLEPRVPALRAVTHTCRASARTSQPPTQQHGPQWEQVPSKEGTWGRRGSPLCCGLRRSPGLRAAGAESRAACASGTAAPSPRWGRGSRARMRAAPQDATASGALGLRPREPRPRGPRPRAALFPRKHRRSPEQPQGRGQRLQDAADACPERPLGVAALGVRPGPGGARGSAGVARPHLLSHAGQRRHPRRRDQGHFSDQRRQLQGPWGPQRLQVSGPLGPRRQPARGWGRQGGRGAAQRPRLPVRPLTSPVPHLWETGSPRRHLRVRRLAAGWRGASGPSWWVHLSPASVLPPPGPRDSRAVQASLSASERGVAQTSPECHAAPAPQARHRLPRRGRRWELPPPPAGPLQKARCLWRDPPTPELTSVRALSTAGDRKPSSNWLKKRGA